jgi:NADH-quinone oxidoreductase subunit M
MSSIAVPLTNGFVGEFLILMGAYLAKSAYVYVAVTGVVLGAAYMLWMVKRVFFGPEGSLVKKYADELEVNLREIAVMAPLIILIFVMGIKPGLFLDWSKASIENLANSKGSYTLSVYEKKSDRDPRSTQVSLKEGEHHGN